MRLRNRKTEMECCVFHNHHFIFLLLCGVMLATSSFAQSHSVEAIHWSALFISFPFSFSHYVPVVFRSHCVIFFE